MSGVRKKIKDGIRELGKADAYEINFGKVSAVSEAETTCDVDIDEGVTVFGVRLRAVITDDKGFWVLPKIGSHVVIAVIENGTDWCLIQPSEVDKAFINIGNKSFEISSAGVKVNGGMNDGVPLVDPLLEKINNLEEIVNDLITKYNSHTHITTATVGASAVAGINAPTTSLVTDVLLLTTKPELENPDFAQ